MSSRNARKEAARERRQEIEAAARLTAARRRRVRLAAAGLGGSAAIAAAVAFVVTSGAPTKPVASIPAPKTTDLKAAAQLAGATFTSYKYAYGIGDHVLSHVTYRQNPPTNGPHYPVPASDGNYAAAATPPTEQLVHSLEHGRIEIQYRPGLPQSQIDQLVALYKEDPQHVLLFENETGMQCDVAVTAWAHGMLCTSFSPAVFDAIRDFRDEYRDHGPEYVA